MSGETTKKGPINLSIVQAATALVRELDGLISESKGAAGRDQNEDSPPWVDQIERLSALEDLRLALMGDQELSARIADLRAKEPGYGTPAYRGDPYEVVVLSEYLERRERSRPCDLPDIALALTGVDLIKSGEPIRPEHIRAIVELAEIGAEQIVAFDLRWDADMKAVALWRADNPGFDLVLPDHCDLVVWLLKSISHQPVPPSTAEVDTLVRSLDRIPALSFRSTELAAASAMIRLLTDGLSYLSRRNFMLESALVQVRADQAQRQRDLGVIHTDVLNS